jgi:hypothetical protein
MRRVLAQHTLRFGHRRGTVKRADRGVGSLVAPYRLYLTAKGL